MATEMLADPGPVIELEGPLDVNAVQQLGQILLRLPRGARAGIDLARARDASAFVLARLAVLLASCCATGRHIALLGLDHGQARLLGHLAARGVWLAGGREIPGR